MKKIWYNLMNKFNILYLISFWVILGAVFGLIFYILPSSLAKINGDTISSLVEAIYFSFITMLTIGYGDIVPVTLIAHILTIIEGLIGWVIFGVIVYKIVSVKEDVILEEIHNISNEEYISRVRHYLFVSNTNISRFIHNMKIKKKIEKSDIYELSVISTTLEANIADARRFLCRERIVNISNVEEEDIMVILKSIDLCLGNLITALNLLPSKIKKDAVLYDNIKKIIEYNTRIYSFCNIHTSDRKIDELRNLTDNLDKYLKNLV